VSTTSTVSPSEAKQKKHNRDIGDATGKHKELLSSTQKEHEQMIRTGTPGVFVGVLPQGGRHCAPQDGRLPSLSLLV
jgi:TctA family transporter